MGATEVLALAIAALNNSAGLMALYSKAVAENRDLTPEEVAQVRALAYAANDKLGADLAAGS